MSSKDSEENYYFYSLFEPSSIFFNNENHSSLLEDSEENIPINLYRINDYIPHAINIFPESTSNISNNGNNKKHTKYSKDNILRKIQVHFHRFIVDYANELIYSRGFKKKFHYIAYSQISDYNNNKFNDLKKKKIGDILKQSLSTKYKKVFQENKKINENLYNEVKNDKIISDFMSEKYIDIFNNIYYKNEKQINNSEINFTLSPKVKTFDDLLNKKREREDFLYKDALKKAAEKYYLSKPIFTTKKMNNNL